MSAFVFPHNPEEMQQKEILIYRLKWLVIFRIVLVTLLLGSALAIQFNASTSRPLELLYVFIILSYVFTASTLYFLKRIRNIQLYAYFQIIYDLVVETGIIYITGGVESLFTFTYIFTIIAASILLLRRGAFIAASLSTIFYGMLVDLQFYQILPSYASTSPLFISVNSSAIYYNIFLNACAFYLVAFLSGYLSESLKRTDQRLREASHDLNELQMFHHNILQSMHSGVLTTDLHGKITSYNHAAEVITGYTLSEVYGEDLCRFFPGLDTQDLLHSSSTFPKAAHRLETTITSKTGTKVYLGFSVALFFDQYAKIAGLIAIFQDLTELKDMEEQIARADRLAAIGELAAGVAHEIRNPLAAISGATQMLKSDLTLSEENQTLMDIILRESTRLDAILSDFLLYARPKPMVFTKCDLLHDAIIPTIGLLKQDQRFSGDKMTIRIDAPPNFPKIACDIEQIQQVFWNLCLNAFQAMPHGGVLTIAAGVKKIEDWEFKTKEPVYAGVISLHDTGEGIDPDTLRYIFHPFYTTKKKGTGLGLAIAHSIIKHHHGMIKVKSSPQTGTTFDVILPLKQ